MQCVTQCRFFLLFWEKMSFIMQHVLFLFALLMRQASAAGQQFLHHNLSTDEGGEILSWLPGPVGTAYAAFATRAAYYFSHQMPTDPATGMPIYYTHGQVRMLVFSLQYPLRELDKNIDRLTTATPSTRRALP